MGRLLARWISLAVAIWVATLLMGDNISVKGDWLTYAGIAFVFGLVNATLGTLTRIFTFPFTILSLGLWLIVINAAMLLITDSFSTALNVTSFGWALLAAIVISIVSTVINSIFNSLRRD